MRSLARLMLAVLVAAPVAAGPAHARELKEFYRGVRAMGMGGAFTAVADDADAVFYNPAGMALNPDYQIRLVNPKIDVSTDDILLISDIRSAAQKLDGAAISSLFGKHIYADLTAYPMIAFPGFSLGYYYDVQTHIVSRNLSLPAVEASYIRDHGIIGGIAHEFRGFRKRDFLRAGVSVKWLTRQGFDKVIPLTELVTADKTYISTLMGAEAKGWGANIGFQYDVGISRSNDLVLATAWQDVGDTQFGNSLQGLRPPSIRNNLSAGFAFIHRFSPSFQARNNIKISAEMRHLLEKNRDPRLKAHLGAELSLGSLSIQGGLNQDSLTAGAKLDMFFLEVAAVTYGVENQSLAFMDRERRYMLQLTLKFDVMGKGSRSKRDDFRRKHPREY